MTQIIETERLSIRELNHQDIESLSNILLDYDVMKYSFRNIKSTDDIKNYIESCLLNYKKFGFGQWAVILKEKNNLIGVCGLNAGFEKDKDIIHINCRFAKLLWGKGLANEAIKGIIKFAKDSLKIPRVYALIEPENVKSIALIKRLCFSHQKSSIYKKRKLDFYLRELI